MAIVQTLTKSSFVNAFKQSSRKDQFSYEALEAIFDYLEEYSNDSGENVELDIVGICCEWAEAHWSEIATEHGILFDDEMTEEGKQEVVSDFLCDETQFVELTDGNFVFMQF